MVKEGDHQGLLANATYSKWLLEAVRKIKHQKQRPSVDRICNAVLQYHKVERDSIIEQLELAVKDGAILKVYNKGLCSYKDPQRVSKLKTRTLRVTKKSDLSDILIRTIKELGEIGGSTLKSVEKFIRQSYSLELVDGVDFSHQLKVSLKRCQNTGGVIQDNKLLKVGYDAGSQDCPSSSKFGTVIPHQFDDYLGHSTANGDKQKVHIYFFSK